MKRGSNTTILEAKYKDIVFGSSIKSMVLVLSVDSSRSNNVGLLICVDALWYHSSLASNLTIVLNKQHHGYYLCCMR